MDEPNALILNCTLKKSPEESNTEALIDIVTGNFDELGVAHETIRPVDFNIPFGVVNDMGDGDEWPQILDNYREHIFDGVVFKDRDGVHRFADAPEVQRTAERGVTLTVTAEQAGSLPPPDEGHPSFTPNLKTGRLSRLFGRGWKKQ